MNATVHYVELWGIKFFPTVSTVADTTDLYQMKALRAALEQASDVLSEANAYAVRWVEDIRGRVEDCRLNQGDLDDDNL